MSMPKEAPQRAKPIGALLFVLGALLVMAMGYLAVRNLASGLVLKPPPIVGEWQAYRTPWRLAFDPDKTVVSSTGPAEKDSSQPWTSRPGTYSIDYFGTLWVTLNNGQVYTATLRADLPNQFDLIDSNTDVVTVFERILRLPTMPEIAPKDPLGRSPP
jgi:hypothetical protein